MLTFKATSISSQSTADPIKVYMEVTMNGQLKCGFHPENMDHRLCPPPFENIY